MRIHRLVLKTLIILFCVHSAFAQGKRALEVSAGENEAVLATKNGVLPKREDGDDHRAREAWFYRGRIVKGASSSQLLHQAWRKRLDLIERRKLESMAAPAGISGVGVSWTQLGPISLNSDAGTKGFQDYGVVTGRVISLAIDPNDPTGNTVYAGSSGGGVWKSTNAAATDPSSVVWIPLTDTQPSLISGAIAIKPDNNNIVLVGTGEGNSSADSYYGQGILRSADGGKTWSVIATANNGTGGTVPLRGVGFTSIAFSQDNPSLVVASTAGAVSFGVSTGIRGLYYSTDAGQTWTLASASDSSSPVGGGNYPASATQVIFNPFTHKFYAALRNHGLYESADGASFTRMAGQPFAALTLVNCPTNTSSGTCPFYRAQFAIQPATHAMFVIAVDGQNVSQGIAMASDTQLSPQSGVASWTVVSDFDPTLPTSNGVPTVPSGITECDSGSCRKLVQGEYNLWIAAVPAGSNNTQLFVGTRDIYRCDLGATANCTAGNAWSNLTKVYDSCGASSVLSPFAHVHPDQHAAVWVTANPAVMFFANDGGVYRTLNGAPGDGCGSVPDPFENLNTNLGPITEFVSFSQHPSDPSILLAGAQDNGSSSTNSILGTHWQAVNGGDGGFNEIDPNAGTDTGTPSGITVPAGNLWYTSNEYVSIQRCISGTACTTTSFGQPPFYTDANIGSAQVDGDQGDFYTPFRLEPQSSALLLVGTCRLWRGPGVGGTTWTGLNALSPMFDYLVTGAPAPNSCGGETNIRSMAAGGPSGASTVNGQQYSVAKVIYVGMSAATDVNGAVTAASGHIFVTRDSTVPAPLWNDITAGTGIGNAPVSDIVVDPSDATGGTVYATVMSFGLPHVLKSTDFGAHWTNITGNLPDAPADAIVLDPNTANTIYVGTDLGVFYTTNGGQNWSVFATGLPSVPVTRMRIFNGQKLRVSTYGRGVWEIRIAIPSSGQPPFGFLDLAQGVGGSTTIAAGGNLQVGGWAVDPQDGAPVQRVEIWVDGTVVGTAGLGMVRNDVAAAYGNLAYTNSGYGGSVSLFGIGLGGHTVTAVAYDSLGLSAALVGARTITITGHPPFGFLDFALGAGGSTTIAAGGNLQVGGWAVDPHDGAPVQRLEIRVDGKTIGNAQLGQPRTDVALAYGNNAYTNSGYSGTVSLTGIAVGPHTVTTVAYDSFGLSTTLTGSRTITVVAQPPFGFLDLANGVGGSTTLLAGSTLRVAGWAVDPHDGAPVQRVEIRVDGTPVGNATLGQMRADVAMAYGNPAYTNSGFGGSVSLFGIGVGGHTVTAVAYDSLGLSTTLAGAQTITITGQPPFGFLDLAQGVGGSTTIAAGGNLQVGGWAVDPQDGAPVQRVEIWVDGTVVGTAGLGMVRNDVAAAYGNLAYTNSGYGGSVSLFGIGLGGHTVTAVAYDSLGLSAALVGARTITITGHPPFGFLDFALGAGGSTTIAAGGNLQVGGWAVDPHDGAPVQRLEIRVDGKTIGNAQLGQPRTDVALAYGNNAYTNSGYSGTVSLTGIAVGPHTVTTVAYDSFGLSTTLTGSRTISVQ